jgi:regulator of sirC expression with transglutaminase-like and TPR domain
MTEDEPPDGDFRDRATAEAFLRAVGRLPDGDLPMAEAALALAARERPRAAIAQYREHLALLVRSVRDTAARAQDLADRVAAFNRVIYGRYGYAGDTITYEDPQNADLMRVIDRRKGLPVALGILAIHVARAQGWQMAGLAFPGHFLVRIEHGGERAILDPFNGGRTRGAPELRELLRAINGSDATLLPQHYELVGDRDVLLRLQNNLKLRHLEAREPAKALAVIEGMLLLAPEATRLLYETALLQVELGAMGAAIAALERFLELTRLDGERRHAALLLQRLRQRLN